MCVTQLIILTQNRLIGTEGVVFFAMGFIKKKFFQVYRVFYHAKESKDEFSRFKQFYNGTILSEKVFEGQKETTALHISIVDKVTPHSLYDFMLIDSGINGRYSIYDYEETIIREYWHTAIKIVNCMQEFSQDYFKNRTEINIGYNYDPYTRDRESIMSEKRFHTHFILYTEKDVALVNHMQVRTSQIDCGLRDRIIDPYLSLGCQLLYDSLRNNGINCMMNIDDARDIKQHLPVGIKFVVDNPEKFLTSDMRFIHQIINETYFEIADAILKKRHGIWFRGKLKNKDEIYDNIEAIRWASSRSKTLLRNYIESRVRRVLDMEQIREHRKELIYHIPLAGPAYSFSWYVNHKAIDNKNGIFCIYPKIYSDMGGAGVTWIGNANAVRIKRGSGIFMEEELISRKNFQRYILKKL